MADTQAPREETKPQPVARRDSATVVPGALVEWCEIHPDHPRESCPKCEGKEARRG